MFWLFYNLIKFYFFFLGSFGNKSYFRYKVKVLLLIKLKLTRLCDLGVQHQKKGTHKSFCIKKKYWKASVMSIYALNLSKACIILRATSRAGRWRILHFSCCQLTKSKTVSVICGEYSFLFRMRTIFKPRCFKLVDLVKVR